MTMMTMKSSMLGAAAVAVMALSGSAFAQAPGATVHGHVLNPAGQDFSSGDVKFTKDKTTPYKDEKFTVTVPLNSDGTYKATGVTPGDYFVYFVQGDKIADRLELTVKPNDTDVTLNDDMSREEYLKSMSPEARKELEEYKKKNAEVVDANKVIAQLNATLKTVRADLAAAQANKDDVSKDVASMKQAVDAKPDTGLLWLTYGDTLQAQGEHLKSEDKKAGKPATSDEDMLKDYSDAADAYKKAVALDSAGAKPNVAGEAVDYNQLGNVEAKLGKTEDASAAFDSAAKTDPTKAGMYYNNEAAVLFNSQQFDGALAAAEKAIAAEPNRPDPYFIKGQVLVTKSTVDPKTNQLTAPPGCVEAYEKYLDLAPNGANSASVREVLASLGTKIDSKYKAGRK